jgi:predicted nucleotidyltransferase
MSKVLNLSDDQLAEVSAIINECLPNADVRAFGSRVTGAARTFSDLDLLVLKPERLSLDQRVQLADAFEASNLPFMVDFLEYSQAPLSWKERVFSESLPIMPR